MSIIIPIEQAQAAIISYLKSMPALVAALGSANQIKEWSWQGDDFTYPCVRLQMGFERPEPGTNCCRWLVSFYVMCFSEQKSSKQASQLASIVASMHMYQPGLLNGINFAPFFVDQIIPPIRQDSLTWRSEVVVHTRMSCYTPPVVPWYLKGGVNLSNCKIAYQPKGATDLANSYINLANPGTNNATPVGSPTWDITNGWTLNGIDQAFLTGSINITNETSVILKFSDYPHPTALIGVFVGEEDTGIATYGFLSGFDYGGGVYSIYYVSGLNGGGEVITYIPAGVVGFTKEGIYIDGIFYPHSSLPETFSINRNYAIGGQYNVPGNDVTYFTPMKIQACALYNTTLTAAQVLAITNAMNAL